VARPQPGPGPPLKLALIQINASCKRMATFNQYAAIDPVVFVLSGRALDIYWLIKHPHNPITANDIHQILKDAAPEEISVTTARAKAMAELATTVLKVTETMAKSR
jgi:hypothetical protein